MKLLATVLLGLGLATGAALAAGSALAAGAEHHGSELIAPPPGDPVATFTGNNVSALVFLSQSPQRAEPLTPGLSSLRTILFIAYLEPGGSARVRTWDHAAGRYNATVVDRWRLDGGQLCLGGRSVGLAVSQFCVETHIWGPVFSGKGTTVDAMIKGDVRPGNAEAL